MKAPPLAKNYTCLTTEERFRLILAAAGRGDEAERDRLAHAGGRITLTMRDHAPYAQAFNDLALLTFIELQEDTARYEECFALAHVTRGAGEAAEEVSDVPAEESDAQADGSAGEEAGCFLTLDLVLASGYVLRTKANGWKLFCERLNVPPFLLWEVLPGFERLQRALARTEKAAFVPEGFLRWLNHVRPKGEPELAAVPLTVERMAAANEEAFRKRVQWWGA